MMKRFFTKWYYLTALATFVYFWPFLAQGVLFSDAPELLSRPLVSIQDAKFPLSKF